MTIKGYFILTVFAFVLFGISCCSSVSVIDTGHRGVKTRFGQVEGQPLAEGIYFTSPFTTSIHTVDVRTQKYEDNTEVYTKDVQAANVQYTVNYSVRGEAAGELFRTVGVDYADKLIPQVVQGALKNATGKWEAADIVSHREDVRHEVQEAISAALSERGLIIEGFQLTDVQFSQDFTRAVESKVVAIQKAEQEKNHTVEVREQANQRVIAAQADAQAMKIKSDALAQNQNLVSYEAVQKWNGVLPTQMLGSAVPFLNITK